MRRILSFSGPIGAGKDTVADYFIRKHGAVRFSFGDHLKQVISLLYHIPLERFHDRVLKTQGHPNLPAGATIRSALQDIGTEALRNYDPNVWISAMRRRLAGATSEFVVITDARFPNEVDMLESLGASLIYVRRSTAEAALYASRMAKLVRLAQTHSYPGLASQLMRLGIELGSFHASEAYNMQFIYDPRFRVLINDLDVTDPRWNVDYLLET